MEVQSVVVCSAFIYLSFFRKQELLTFFLIALISEGEQRAKSLFLCLFNEILSLT